MPRNSSGSYTLPAGNPVTSGTTISTTWANSTLSDLGTEISDSASRSGKGGFTAPVRVPDGTAAAPAVAFTTEVNSGVYRAGAGDVRLSLGGVDFLTRGGISFPVTGATLSVTGADAQIVLQGNRNAASTTTEVAIVPSVTRTAGLLLQLFNSIPRLAIDYLGLLRLDAGAAAAAIQPASLWTAITPGAGWTASAGLAYCKDAMGFVHLKGSITPTAGGGLAFTLPAGFRPAAPRFIFVAGASSFVDIQWAIDVTGTVVNTAAVNGRTYSFDCISFIAEA